MRIRLRTLPLLMLLALGAATSAHAQSKAGRDRVELPIWNKSSGQFEGVVVLEPADNAKSRTLSRFGVRHLDSTFGLGAGDSLGLLCDRKQGLTSALNNLADNCVLASFPSSRRTGAAALFQRNGTQVGVGAGSTRTTMPAWLAPSAGGNGRVDVKARLQTPAEIPGFSDRWTSRQLNVGGGVGAFGVNVIGEVVDTPGRDQWSSLGLGLSWRTPWSGQLTVGADNLVTRGKNPFAPNAVQGEDEGAVPYVRYEQDL
jgi:hypothetical protein